MAVYRVEKTRSFTVMCNYHLRDTRLTLKAKGLLSLMLSLPDNWNFTSAGLASICREGVSSIRATLQELENTGYMTRQQLRDDKGRITDVEYTIYEKSISANPPDEDTRVKGNDDQETSAAPTCKPMSDDPVVEKVHSGDSPENGPDCSLEEDADEHEDHGDEACTRQPSGLAQSLHDIPDMQQLNARREKIRSNIAYEQLSLQYGTERMDGIVEIILDVLCSKRSHYRIGENEYPALFVKKRLSELDSLHIQYVIECLDNNRTFINNIKAYMIAALFNAPTTIDEYYAARCNHNFVDTPSIQSSHTDIDYDFDDTFSGVS